MKFLTTFVDPSANEVLCLGCGLRTTPESEDVHTEGASGKFHVHCVTCANQIIIDGARIRRSVRRSAHICYDTPLRDTLRSYEIHPDWHRYTVPAMRGTQDRLICWRNRREPGTIYVYDHTTRPAMAPASAEVLRLLGDPEAVNAAFASLEFRQGVQAQLAR